MSMEPIAHVIAKRDSFRHLWKLLAPKTEYADLYVPCMRRWNGFSYRRQQQIYWYLREKKRKGQLSHPYMTTGKTIALTRQTFVGKVWFL